jgi:CheY-like chemotaxis protein
LIFCDIGLPVLDGYKVLARLKSDPATAKIPVIAISAHAAPNEIKQGLGAGFVCYITKPFSIEDIRDTLRQVLP